MQRFDLSTQLVNLASNPSIYFTAFDSVASEIKTVWKSPSRKQEIEISAYQIEGSPYGEFKSSPNSFTRSSTETGVWTLDAAYLYDPDGEVRELNRIDFSNKDHPYTFEITDQLDKTPPNCIVQYISKLIWENSR